MEFQMEKMEINCDKIKRARQILKGVRGYVRTGEQEQFDDEQKKKRKAEEELREQEEKRLKTITSGEEPKEKMKSAELEQEEGYRNKLARQQQEIIRQQEVLLQKQEQHIAEQEKRIHAMEEKQIQPQHEQPQQEKHTSFPKASTSGGAGTIDKFLRPSALRFLTKCVKKEPEEEQEDDKGDGDGEEDKVIVTEVTQKTETVKYLPKSVAGLENLVLVPLPKMKGSSKRSSKGPPVPKGRQDPKRFYCDQCECNYNRPDELTCHKRKDCGKKEPEFFCEECGKGFFHENGVREHYYHQHTDMFLWYCTKCGQGFHFKSNKSKHKTACPNPNGPDKFEGRIPYDEAIEATFQKRQAIPVQIPQQQDEGELTDQDVVQYQPLAQDQPKAQEQPQGKSTDELETEKAVEAIGGGELLNIMAGGVIPDAIVVPEEEPEVKPDILEVEMEFN